MATFTYTNNSGLTFPDNGATSQALNIFGLAGHAITDVSVTLTGLNHTWASDLDILLVAPDTVHNLLFMSDVRSSDDFVNSTLTFSDTATDILSDISDSAPIDSGLYLPTAYAPGETDADFGSVTGAIFSPPPSGPSSFTGAFNSVDPNGNWTLYVRDDDAGITGSLASWALTVATNFDIVTLNGAGGADTFLISPSGAASGAFSFNGSESVTYDDVSGFHIDAGGGNDFVQGSGGSDTITGGGGRDQLFGAGGDDRFLMFSGDTATGEVYDGGADFDVLSFGGLNFDIDMRNLTIRSIETLQFNDPGVGNSATARLNASQFGTGFSLTGSVGGNDAGDVTDIIEVTMGAVSSLNLSSLTISGFAGTFDTVRITGDGSAETITGTSVHDEIFGNGGADILNGFTGADLMAGGTGDDQYTVDNINDVTDEVNGGGGVFDQVFASVSFAAALGIEQLTLTGSANINATGRGTQNDILIGNNGNNILNGLSGYDVMRGGLGNDTYYVDHAADTTDEVNGGGGIGDFVYSSISFTAAQGIERLYLTGAGNINATGRAGQNDILVGNNGNNILDGLSGADSLQGGFGNDTYYVDNIADSVVEVLNWGTDFVYSSVTFTVAANTERLYLTGSAAINGTGRDGQNDIITGNSGINTLSGLTGNDVLTGGLGSDILTGGAGLDTFRFDAALGAANMDTVTDFIAADDVMQLENAIFTLLGVTGTLAANLFRDLALGAQDADDVIIYNRTTGALFYDTNGLTAGGQTQFADLTNGLIITNADFAVI